MGQESIEEESPGLPREVLTMYNITNPTEWERAKANAIWSVYDRISFKKAMHIWTQVSGLEDNKTLFEWFKRKFTELGNANYAFEEDKLKAYTALLGLVGSVSRCVITEVRSSYFKVDST